MSKKYVPQVFKHFRNNQSVLLVFPTQIAAREHFFQDLQDAPPKSKIPVEHLVNKLSMIRSDSNPRRPIAARYISASSDPDIYRGFQAIIEFPVGITRSNSRDYERWMTMQRIHERYRVQLD